MDRNREKLIHCITEVSFYLDDLRLFLDTHPCDREPRMYKILEEHKFIKTKIDELKNNPNYTKTKIVNGMMEITSYGQQFCNICIGKFC